jgi:hypothetical protein
MYILAKWEGTAYNNKIINSAKVKGFKTLPNKYYVTNAGYFNIPITLTPYYSV